MSSGRATAPPESPSRAASNGNQFQQKQHQQQQQQQQQLFPSQIQMGSVHGSAQLPPGMLLTSSSIPFAQHVPGSSTFRISSSTAASESPSMGFDNGDDNDVNQIRGFATSTNTTTTPGAIGSEYGYGHQTSAVSGIYGTNCPYGSNNNNNNNNALPYDYQQQQQFLQSQYTLQRTVVEVVPMDLSKVSDPVDIGNLKAINSQLCKLGDNVPCYVRKAIEDIGESYKVTFEWGSESNWVPIDSQALNRIRIDVPNVEKVSQATNKILVILRRNDTTIRSEGANGGGGAGGEGADGGMDGPNTRASLYKGYKIMRDMETSMGFTQSPFLTSDASSPAGAISSYYPMDERLTIKTGCNVDECRRFVESRIELLKRVKTELIDVPLAQKQMAYERASMSLAKRVAASKVDGGEERERRMERRRRKDGNNHRKGRSQITKEGSRRQQK